MKLSDIIKRFEVAGIDNAAHDARVLFCEYSGIAMGEPIPHGAECADPRLEDAVRRREEREPLQYIIGKVGFFREEYTVTHDVLIPRSDTEHLVEYAAEHIPPYENFIDICTGSGCIAVSTLANTVGTTALALDISEGALRVAEENAVRNGVADRLTLKRCDILTEEDELAGEYFAVLSNPPYVTNTAYADLAPEIYKEPKSAFIGGEDGGDFYRVLVPLAKRLVKPCGFIAFEIGYDQKELITSLAEKHGLTLEILRDYSGLDRVALMRKT